MILLVTEDLIASNNDIVSVKNVRDRIEVPCSILIRGGGLSLLRVRASAGIGLLCVIIMCLQQSSNNPLA